MKLCDQTAISSHNNQLLSSKYSVDEEIKFHILTFSLCKCKPRESET